MSYNNAMERKVSAEKSKYLEVFIVGYSSIKKYLISYMIFFNNLKVISLLVKQRITSSGVWKRINLIIVI